MPQIPLLAIWRHCLNNFKNVFTGKHLRKNINAMGVQK